MTLSTDPIWTPEKSDRETMRLMFSLGKTYNEYYFFNYGKELGLLFEWLSLAIARMDHGHELFDKDRKNFHAIKEKLKNKINDIVDPRFKPGDLVKFSNHIGVVVEAPRVDDIRCKIVVDVLSEGTITPVSLSSLRATCRPSKKVNHQVSPHLQ